MKQKHYHVFIYNNICEPYGGTNEYYESYFTVEEAKKAVERYTQGRNADTVEIIMTLSDGSLAPYIIWRNNVSGEAEWKGHDFHTPWGYKELFVYNKKRRT